MPTKIHPLPYWSSSELWKHTNLPKIFQHPPPFVFGEKLPLSRVYMTLCLASFPFILNIFPLFWLYRALCPKNTIFFLPRFSGRSSCLGPPTPLFFQPSPFISSRVISGIILLQKGVPTPIHHLPAQDTAVLCLQFTPDHGKGLLLVPCFLPSTRPIRAELSCFCAQVPAQSLYREALNILTEAPRPSMIQWGSGPTKSHKTPLLLRGNSDIVSSSKHPVILKGSFSIQNFWRHYLLKECSYHHFSVEDCSNVLFSLFGGPYLN